MCRGEGRGNKTSRRAGARFSVSRKGKGKKTSRRAGARFSIPVATVSVTSCPRKTASRMELSRPVEPSGPHKRAREQDNELEVRVLEADDSVVRQWAGGNNQVARSLVEAAMYTPSGLRDVADWQTELYAALTNTLWVHEETNLYTSMSFRDASGLVAFLDSVMGDRPGQDYMDGPYCSPSGDDDLPPNEMHRFMEERGFRRAQFPRSRACWEMYAGGYGPVMKTVPPDAALDDFWRSAVRAYWGEVK